MLSGASNHGDMETNIEIKTFFKEKLKKKLLLALKGTAIYNSLYGNNGSLR